MSNPPPTMTRHRFAATQTDDEDDRRWPPPTCLAQPWIRAHDPKSKLVTRVSPWPPDPHARRPTPPLSYSPTCARIPDVCRNVWTRTRDGEVAPLCQAHLSRETSATRAAAYRAGARIRDGAVQQVSVRNRLYDPLAAAWRRSAVCQEIFERCKLEMDYLRLNASPQVTGWVDIRCSPPAK
jgi:hypothetical protein